MAEQAPPRHKRRTVPHKKHAAFPGIKLKDDVKVEHGSIRTLESKKSSQISDKMPPIKASPIIELEKFYIASRALADNAKKSHNTPLGSRTMVEWMYGYQYRKAMNKGLVSKIKRKYQGTLS